MARTSVSVLPQIASVGKKDRAFMRWNRFLIRKSCNSGIPPFFVTGEIEPRHD